jgi:hypothetical protein
MLLERLELFKCEQPMMLLISRRRGWRVKEIFESMLDKSGDYPLLERQ